MKKVIYLSGPISGYEATSFHEFGRAQEAIEAMGHTVLNPHELCRRVNPADYQTPELHWEACMRICLAALPYAHVLVTLKDWEVSRGAKKEVAIARETGFIEVAHILNFLKTKC